MEQQEQVRQKRETRNMETREAFARPAMWRPPEALPMPDERQIGRAHV